MNTCLAQSGQIFPEIRFLTSFLTRPNFVIFFQFICGFYGTQKDCLNLTVSAQKSVLKTEQPGPRYLWKSFETWRAKSNRQLKTVFDWYLGPGCSVFQTDFCIETT